MRTLSAALLLVAPVLAGCTDAKEVEEPTDSSGIWSLTQERCRALVPDGALDALGWSGAGIARLDSDTCTRTATEGTVSVSRRPVPAVGGSDLPAAADTMFAERCDEVAATPEAAEGIADGGQGACALLPDADRTVSILVVHTDADAVLEVRVDSDAPTDLAHRAAGLDALGAAAVGTR